MAHTWLTIRVELLSGLYAECDPAPGRVFLVGPRHTFQQLARAINVGFARWDHSHLYDFELADGNVGGIPDHDWGEDEILDHATTKVLERVGPGARFRFRFDFGDEWIHECMVDDAKVDPIEAYGEPPAEPVPICGWGTIPDQYGRTIDDRARVPVRARDRLPVPARRARADHRDQRR